MREGPRISTEERPGSAERRGERAAQDAWSAERRGEQSAEDLGSAEYRGERSSQEQGHQEDSDLLTRIRTLEVPPKARFRRLAWELAVRGVRRERDAEVIGRTRGLESRTAIRVLERLISFFEKLAASLIRLLLSSKDRKRLLDLQTLYKSTRLASALHQGPELNRR